VRIFSRARKIKKKSMFSPERNFIPYGVENEKNGKVFEGCLFGSVPKVGVSEYEDPERAFERIKRMQENPENPKCPFMRKFLEKVVMEIRRFKGESDEVAKRLKRVQGEKQSTFYCVSEKKGEKH
jgi:hypothetical protein